MSCTSRQQESVGIVEQLSESCRRFRDAGNRKRNCTLRGEGSALPGPLLPRCRAAAACAPGQGPKMGALSARKRATAAWRCHLAVSRDGAGLCAECRENEPAREKAVCACCITLTETLVTSTLKPRQGGNPDMSVNWQRPVHDGGPGLLPLPPCASSWMDPAAHGAPAVRLSRSPVACRETRGHLPPR
jgi:hypothetical protein